MSELIRQAWDSTPSATGQKRPVCPINTYVLFSTYSIGDLPAEVWHKPLSVAMLSA